MYYLIITSTVQSAKTFQDLVGQSLSHVAVLWILFMSIALSFVLLLQSLSFGSDDNGSSIVAILELARLFSRYSIQTIYLYVYSFKADPQDFCLCSYSTSLTVLCFVYHRLYTDSRMQAKYPFMSFQVFCTLCN